MKNKEFADPPEINIQELITIINSLTIEWEETFEFNDRIYVLYPSEENYKKEDGAFWSPHSNLGDVDIYVSVNLSPDKIKERIFHQVMAAELANQGLDSHQAHQRATEILEKIKSQN